MTVDGIQEHTLPRPTGLIECGVVLDVGAGIRPMQWYQPEHHTCVEPYGPYCEILAKCGYDAQQMTAEEALMQWKADAVYLLDVIEHMQKAEGWRVLGLAQQVAQQQVVVYTPVGFVEQAEDVWGLGGEYWQAHRSGWEPQEFPDWSIQYFHAPKEPSPEGFFAIWPKLVGGANESGSV